MVDLIPELVDTTSEGHPLDLLILKFFRAATPAIARAIRLFDKSRSFDEIVSTTTARYDEAEKIIRAGRG